MGVTAPPATPATGLPVAGDVLSINMPVITHVVGAFNPSQPVLAANSDTGVVLLQTELTAAGAPGLVTAMDLVASGSGDDVTGVAQVAVVQEDPASTNGIVDGMDMVVATGTYPTDDGTLTVMPGISLPLATPVSLLFVYDFTATASGAAPPSTYDVTVTNLVTGGTVVTPGGVPSGSAVVDVRCPVTSCGDCNGDGIINIVDALFAAQHAVSIIVLTGVDFSNCNVVGLTEPDPGAVVDVIDALNVAQVSAGLPVMLACCVP
jgi:hypothetical protein